MHIDREAALWIGEAIVAVASFETGIARFASAFSHAPKKVLESPLQPQEHILEDLAMDILVLLT